MQLYNNFIGIDIGKFNFVVGVHGQKETKEYNNTMQEIKEFSKTSKVLQSVLTEKSKNLKSLIFGNKIANKIFIK